jgi:hypothetical protein
MNTMFGCLSVAAAGAAANEVAKVLRVMACAAPIIQHGILTGMKQIPVATAALVVIAAGVWIAAGSLVIESARRHDFLNLYTGARLALAGRFAEMHLPAVQLEVERQLVSGVDPVVPFVRPHFYALFLAPLALLDFGTAFNVWLGIQTLALLACWLWGFRRFGPDSLFYSALFLPTALGIAHGQDCVWMLAISIAAYSLAARGRPLASGLVLSLGFAKFHLFLLWPLALLLSKRWRMLAGLTAGACAEALISLSLGGTAGIGNYIALLRNKDLERLSPSPEIMINTQGISANLFAGSPSATAILTVLVLVLWFIAVRRASLDTWWAATALAGLQIVPHVYGYDAALLLLPLWLMIFASHRKPVRVAAALSSTPIPYLMNLAQRPWCAVSSLTLLAFLVAIAWGGSSRPPSTGE